MVGSGLLPYFDSRLLVGTARVHEYAEVFIKTVLSRFQPPQETVFASFLFILYPSDFQEHSYSSSVQKET